MFTIYSIVAILRIQNVCLHTYIVTILVVCITLIRNWEMQIYTLSISRQFKRFDNIASAIQFKNTMNFNLAVLCRLY